MALPTINPTTTKAWKALQSHYQNIKNQHLNDLFAQSPDRANDMTISWNDFYIDYSKNRIDQTTKNLLLDLAKEVQLDRAIKAWLPK